MLTDLMHETRILKSKQSITQKRFTQDESFPSKSENLQDHMIDS